MWVAIIVMCIVAAVLWKLSGLALLAATDPEGRGAKFYVPGLVMRWTAVGLVVISAVLACTKVANAQQVMRGETSPGVYTNVNVDATGAVKVAGGSSGGSASGTAVSGNPTRIGYQARTSNYTAVSNGFTADAISTTIGVIIVKPYSIPEADWSYASPSGGIVNNTDIVMSIGLSALRNYVTGCSFTNASSSVATEMVIKDGSSTVIWRGYVGVSTSANSTMSVTFRTPLRGSTSTNMVLAAVTTGSQVYGNCQGYSAP